MLKKKPGFFKRAFRGAALGTAIFVAAVPAGLEVAAAVDDMTRGGGTALTQGEKDLVHGIFGNQIDTSKVRKHFGPPKGNIAATVEGGSRRHINFWGKLWHSDDYSKDWISRRSVFMHEMTHLWQHQNYVLLFNDLIRGCKVYAYELDDNSHFDGFCVEQQASIIGDYIEAIYTPPSPFEDPKVREKLLRVRAELFRVVEEKFPQARVTRQELEKQAEIDGKSIAYRSLTPAA